MQMDIFFVKEQYIYLENRIFKNYLIVDFRGSRGFSFQNLKYTAETTILKPETDTIRLPLY